MSGTTKRGILGLIGAGAATLATGRGETGRYPDAPNGPDPGWAARADTIAKQAGECVPISPLKAALSQAIQERYAARERGLEIRIASLHRLNAPSHAWKDWMANQLRKERSGLWQQLKEELKEALK